MLLKGVYFDQLDLVSGQASHPNQEHHELRFSDDATLSDRTRLKDEYGIKTIMDLRTVYVSHQFLALILTSAELSMPTKQRSVKEISKFPLSLNRMKRLRSP